MLYLHLPFFCDTGTNSSSMVHAITNRCRWYVAHLRKH